MAKVIANRQCVICGKSNVQLWTIDNMRKVVVTYLCKDDAAPLVAIMDAAGDKTPDEQIPLTMRNELEQFERTPTRGRRQPEMVPLNWIPPTPVDLLRQPPEPPAELRATRWQADAEQAARKAEERETTKAARKAAREQSEAARAAARAEHEAGEDRLVRKAREDGKTWAQIGELIGTSGQNAWGKYGKRYKAKGPKAKVSG